MTLTEAAQIIYLERLQKLTFDDMTRAAQRTIEEWEKPCMMPPLSFILERAYLAEDSNKLMTAQELAAKYAGHVDDPEERRAIIAEGRERMEIVKRSMLDVKGFPTHRETSEQLAAERNGVSTIPADPVERHSWAIQKAKDQGWA